MTSSEPWPPPDATELLWCVAAPPQGRLLLAGFAKRTYAIGDGKLSLADEQCPLVIEPEVGEEGDELPSWLEDDTDLLAPKAATDVIVAGAAYAPEPTKQLFVSVAVGRSVRRLQVHGERRVEIDSAGRLRFSSPEPFDSVPLCPQNAYGGRDLYGQWALEEDEQGRRLIDLPESLRPRETVWLYEYPRNPVGRGFFLDVDRQRVAGELLPQVEDPSDLLTPDRLFRAAPTAWIDAPIPGLLGWMHHSWYPRLVRYLGHMLDHDPPVGELREAGLADGDDLRLDYGHPVDGHEQDGVHPRALQGAAPGLAVERLRGDELVVLENLHPDRPRIELSLPAERPKFSIRPSDVEALTPEAVLQTVRLEPDRERLSLTWTGAVPLLGPVDDDFVMNTPLHVSWRS
jgi:hypothetical protein